MNDTKLIAFIFAFLALVGFAAFQFQGDEERNENVGALALYNTLITTTHSSSTVSASSGDATIVLTANGGRQYAKITNTDANVAHCVLGATSTLATGGDVQGILLTASGGSYEIDGDNLWRGIVSCYSVGGTSVVSTVTSP